MSSDKIKKEELPYALLNCPIRFNPFQYDAYNYWKEEKHNIFIADEVGLGKTIEVGIIIKQELVEAKENHNPKFLIVVPKFLCAQWQEQLEKLFYIHSKILVKGIIDNTNYSVYILPLSQIKNFNEKSKKIDFSVVVVDEVHYYRNSTSARYKELKKLLNINNCGKIFLSATPINNSSSDWDNEINLFGENADIVFTHNRKAEAFPGCQVRNISTIYCELNEQEQNFYDTTDNVNNTEFGKTSFRHIGSSSLYALQQCYYNNGFDEYELEEMRNDFEEAYEEEETLLNELKIPDVNLYDKNYRTDSKAEKLINTIKKMFENGADKIVIFAHYLETCKHICAYIYANMIEKNEAYALYSVPVKMPNDKANRKFEEKYEGKLKSLDEQNKVIECFKNTKDKAILICSDMLKEGVNLQCANIIINYDIPFNPAILEQRIGRVDRVGQDKELFIYNFIVEDTYDITVYYKFILGKLGVIKNFAKQDKVNDINISQEQSFEYAVKKALTYYKQEENDTEEIRKNKEMKQKEVRDYLIGYILNVKRNDLNESDDETLKQDMESRRITVEQFEKYKIIKSILVDEKRNLNDLNENDLIECVKTAYVGNCKTDAGDAFKNKLNNFESKYKTIKEVLNEYGANNSFCFDIEVDKNKVNEIWNKEGIRRNLLSKNIISNYEELMRKLKDTQDLSKVNNLNIKDNIRINYEYLNPDINTGNLNILDWNEYVENYIPLEIVKAIKKLKC